MNLNVLMAIGATLMTVLLGMVMAGSMWHIRQKYPYDKTWHLAVAFFTLIYLGVVYHLIKFLIHL